MRYVENGEPIDDYNMPKSIGRKSLVNDPYRGVMYFSRKIGWNKGDAAVVNYLEFHWVNEFRNEISISENNINSPEKYLNKRILSSHYCNRYAKINRYKWSYSIRTRQERGMGFEK